MGDVNYLENTFGRGFDTFDPLELRCTFCVFGSLCQKSATQSRLARVTLLVGWLLDLGDEETVRHETVRPRV
jgi:hypothetical protein